MASNFRTREFDARLCVPSNTTTTNNRSDQSFDLGFSANRQALMMRNAALLRQWEKERIREEIMAEEILRRRELELEVRRELAVDREFARRRAQTMLSFPRPAIHGPMMTPTLAPPFQRPAMPMPTTTPTLAGLGNGHPGKVVFLAKPTTSPNISGKKPKAYYIGDKKFIVSGKKKKPKVWVCALCKTSASSEQELDEHLQEKKHLENVAELKANKSSKKQGSSSSLSEKTIDGTSKDKQEAKPQNEDVHKNLFGFWCQDCNLYCSSEIDFASHQKGKKHIARLEALKQNSDNVDCLGTSDNAEKGEGFEMTEKEVMENVGGELPIIKKVEEKTTKVLNPTEALENISDESVTHEESNRFPSLELREKQEEELGPKDLKKNFLLWCETVLASYPKGQKYMAHLRAREKVVAIDPFSTNHNNGTSNIGDDSIQRHEKTVGTMDGEANVTSEAEKGVQASDSTLKNEPVEATKALGDKTDKAIKTINSSQVASLVQEDKKKYKLTLEEYKKTFKFWCEDCQIGCPIDAAMDIHLKGKKHIARLKALTQHFVIVNSPGTSDTAEKTEGSEATKRETTEIVGGVAQAVKKVEEETIKALNPTEGLENRTDESINHVKSIGSLSPNLAEKSEEKQGLEDLKKFMFWCEDCQLGLGSEGSIVSHLMGKKHMKRVRSRNKVVATDSTSSIHDNSTSKTGDDFIVEGIKVLDSTINNESGEATTLGSKIDDAINTTNSSQVPSLQQEEKKEEKTMIEDLKKKYEFWCEDCELGLDSEGSIIAHLMGKKHMRRLTRNKVVATNSISSIHDNSTSKTGDGSIGEGEATTLGSKTDEGVETANSSRVPTLEQVKKEEKMTIEDLKKKFEFWCEDCQIGCHSRIVMDDHLKGMKHARRLMQCVGAAASATTTANGSNCSGSNCG
ncbi:hypothetical protein Sjap_010844 [Stephania japonica]|uniref:C2H2-type domain-containing protein n=1 Tax=Stephania japonica TaxID=461633 RepID=A0AAP0P436_9MAGN